MPIILFDKVGLFIQLIDLTGTVYERTFSILVVSVSYLSVYLYKPNNSKKDFLKFRFSEL